MTAPLFFASDNGSGIHPEVLDAIGRANTGFATAYGDDSYTASAVNALREEFGVGAEIYFTFGGTGANVVGLASIARSFHAIYCADCSHIWSDECGAPEKFFGGKLIPVPSNFGKITPQSVRENMGDSRGVHHAVPRVLSITQPTEWGTLYQPEEIQALARFAHEHDMLLHVDGARLANAAAALGTSLGDITFELGVDVLSFGGTKNGLMVGEAIIYRNATLTADTGFLRKQATQLASKMRFLSTQFEALMHNELWRRNATHANAMARRLAAGLEGIDGVSLVCPSEINALFVRLDPRYVVPLLERSQFYLWDERASIARWMTSFNTREAEVDAFIALITAVAARYSQTPDPLRTTTEEPRS